ncbi:MAG TPA: hypothetical protein VFY93_15040 [Planctomycetota bacterium]|nr:hypothetical protein [Planctomycetota bacterium]
MRAIIIFLGTALGFSCASAEGKLTDLSWGPPVKSDYEAMVKRARDQTLRRYPKGFDPDRTDEAKGDLYTVWNYSMVPDYFRSKRMRARVKVEDMGGGSVRVGVAVVSQLNDNIDNPDKIDEARWIRTTRDEDAAGLLVSAILLRQLEAEPSEYWKEKQRTTPSDKPRQDIIDRSKDVNLDEPPDPRDVKSLDPITGGRGD